MIILKTGRQAVSPHLKEIVAASNTERKALGFLPEAAYRDFIRREQIIVAVDDKSGKLVGYTIFAGVYPSAKVRQTYVSPKYRKQGIGEKLLSELVARCEDQCYLSITATVATDLKGANLFYNRMGFNVVAKKDGGKSSGRTLSVRVRELDTPNLLNLGSFDRHSAEEVRLDVPETGAAPFYLLDLNVLFDAAKRRDNGSAGKIFAAAFENSVRLAIAEEFVKELERTADNFPDDPVLQLARSLPIVRKPSGRQTKLTNDVAALVFPDRYRAQSLTEQDKSDIAHLVTAIVENTAGLITSEKAILRHAEEFSRRFSVDVISPLVFGAASQDSSYNSTPTTAFEVDGRSLTSSELDARDIAAARALAEIQGIPTAVIRAALSAGTTKSPRIRFAVRSENNLIAVGTWDIASVQTGSRLYLFADYSDDLATVAIDHLIDVACRSVSEKQSTILTLNLAATDSITRERAIRRGFGGKERAKNTGGKLQKICLGKCVTPENWHVTAQELRQRFGLVVSSVAPTFETPEARLSISSKSGTDATILLSTLEDFLSPTLLALDQRPAVIAPIRPVFAEALFRGTQQPDFLVASQATVRSEKCYLLDRKGISLVPEHGLLVFYESQGNPKQPGRSAATAIGRIRRRYLASKDTAFRIAKLSGVLPQTEIEAMARGSELCVVEFDNLLMLRKPVGLNMLKSLGCADGANMVTARALSNDSLRALLAQGEPYAPANP